MKNLKNPSTKRLIVLLCALFTIGLSNAAEVERITKPFTDMKLTKEESVDNIISDIINGNFKDDIDYLEILPSPKHEYMYNEETETSMIGYVYQVLGQHYMMKEKDASRAAISYFRSLKYYPFNDELIFYLRNLGVRSFSNEKNIEDALKKIR